jgi:hypothetical protein
MKYAPWPGAAVLAPGQNPDQLRQLSLVTRHSHLRSAGRPDMTSLRAFDPRQRAALVSERSSAAL